MGNKKQIYVKGTKEIKIKLENSNSNSGADFETVKIIELKREYSYITLTKNTPNNYNKRYMGCRHFFFGTVYYLST